MKQNILKKIPIVYVTLVIVVVVNILMNEKMLTASGISNLFFQATPTIFVCMAQTIVLLTGDMNIAVDGIVNLTVVIVALTMQKIGWLSLPLAVCIAAAAGFLMAFIATRFKVSSIIVTLASSMILSGIALKLMPIPGGYVMPSYGAFLKGSLLGIPNNCLLLLAALGLWRILYHTKLGLDIYATGGNRLSAFESGVRVDRVRIASTMISCVLAAFAGMILLGKTMSADATIGTPYVVSSVTGSILGGVSFAGGVGGMGGAVAGGIIVTILSNVLFFLNIDAAYQYVVQGVILVLSVAIGVIGNRIKIRIGK